MLEVWFAGCHSDVGGGAVGNETYHAFANISLWWMVKQVILSNCGVLFDAAAVRTAASGVSTIVSPAHPVPTTGTDLFAGVNAEIRSIVDDEIQSIVNDEIQAVVDGGMQAGVDNGIHAVINDELKKAPWKWWFLEIFPARYEWQDPNGKWRSRVRCVSLNSIRFNWSPLSGTAAF